MNRHGKAYNESKPSKRVKNLHHWHDRHYKTRTPLRWFVRWYLDDAIPGIPEGEEKQEIAAPFVSWVKAKGIKYSEPTPREKEEQ